jgi:DTW domain-containing protein YfiP
MAPQRSINPGCPRCHARGAPCLCPQIPAVSARLEVVVLRHAAEAHKQTNSARWAALALGCRVIDYAATAAPFDAGELPLEGAWLLFPYGEPTPVPAVPPRRLIVPDGTWAQARRMVQRLPQLRALPRLRLGPPPVVPRLRRPLHPSGMSTLEAIAAALEACGEPGPAARLFALHAAVMERSERMRGYRPPHRYD